MLQLTNEIALLAQWPENLTVSEWAAKHGVLSSETSAQPGRFVAFPYQIGILDAASDPEIEKITVMKSARVGYSACLNMMLGFFVQNESAGILVVQPREADAMDFSRTEVANFLRDSPCFAPLIGEVNARSGEQRIVKRSFNNGASISFAGANSPAGLRRITVRVCLMDEVDGWPPGGAGDEGDQVQLASKRTETFFNRKIIMGSTPTNKETSRVAKSFATSDQRFYYVPCPNPKCGHMQTLKFKNLTWDKDADGTHHPETAHFVCEKNGCIIEEKHKAKMLSLGEWRATKPSLGHAGFFIWTAYSLSANATWRQIAEEHIAAKEDILLRKTFTNTTLGETWEESGESVDSNSLIRRIENYDGATVPLPVTTLTFGTDVQDNRLETIVLGWGPKEECWVIDYKIFHGSPGEGPQVWGDLDHFLYGEYIREDGQKLRIRAGAIDTGGHFGSAVYDFCKKRIGRSIFPIKGIENGRVWPRVAKRNKNNELIYNVGTSQAKDILYAHLRMDKMGGPGFIHFPAGVCDEDFFKQLTSETCQTVWKAGRSSRKWILKKNQRNEVLDCMVYAFAAYKSLPHSDSMMQPPKPVYVDAVSGKPLAKNEPTSEVNLDNLFPQQIRKRRSISSMLPH